MELVYRQLSKHMKAGGELIAAERCDDTDFMIDTMKRNARFWKLEDDIARNARHLLIGTIPIHILRFVRNNVPFKL